MNTVTISNNSVNFEITKDGCRVVPSNDVPQNVTWEQMEDVEQLSDVFCDYTVKQFKHVVAILGDIYRCRDTVYNNLI
jgi:hypothetical protein